MRVMVIEDSQPGQKILNMTLLRMGFEVECFSDGASAWKRLKAEPKGWVFILCEITVPKMNGIKLLENIRSHDQLKDLYVFLLTVVADKKYVIESKRFHVNGLIVKPITYEKVLRKIQPLFPDKKFSQAA